MCSSPKLTDLDLKGVDTVAVDLETYDPDLKTKGSGAVRGNGFVCGIAIATSKQTLYFPLKHVMTDNIPRKKAWDYLNKKLFQNPNIKKVFHNAMYDVCWIRAESGLMPHGPLFDTMVAASVIDENRMRYSLDALSKDYLKESKYKYDLQEKTLAWSQGTIKDPMVNMHNLSYDLVKDYAEQDVNLTLKLWNLFNVRLDQEEKVEIGTKNEKTKTLRHIFELETRLFPCLVDMKFKGVRFDIESAEKLGKRLKKTKTNIVDYIKRRTGVKIEIWAAASIKKLLDKLEIKDYKTTPKSKLGRFSMSNPNLQQIPAKGFIGKKMRELFLPEEGCMWGAFDYSQQEPRIVVHYALKLGLHGAEKVADSYRNDSSADFHRIVATMANIPRITAKTINLGLFYGMGKNKLAEQLNLEYTEAKELFEKYHNHVPFVRRLSYDLQEFAGRNKFLYTLEDRFCRFDKWEPMDKKWDAKEKRFVIKGDKPVPLLSREDAEVLYKAELMDKGYPSDSELKNFENHYQPAFIYRALNKLIQGSAADMTKKAMVLLYENGILPHIQIHDELCISISNEEQAKKIKDIMEQAIKLEIPNKVDYESGPNWGSIK